ncbi:MAG: hypothetical protein CTY12_00770 [Methylotenera sp.]|nr:MAG: hypothetical protein CTY12_00770 [Methylotenera sp.]
MWELGYFRRRREYVRGEDKVILYLCGYCGHSIEKVIGQMTEEEYDISHPEECQRITSWMNVHGITCESEDGPIDWI